MTRRIFFKGILKSKFQTNAPRRWEGEGISLFQDHIHRWITIRKRTPSSHEGRQNLKLSKNLILRNLLIMTLWIKEQKS